MKLDKKRSYSLAFLILLTSIGQMPACKQPEAKPVEVIQRFASGEISRRHFEVNGKKEGLMAEYYRDGQVRSERLFKNDKQTGRSVFFYPKGQTKEIQYFDENGLKQGGDSTFYENGSLQLLMNFENGKKHGYLRKWSPEGNLIYEVRYERDTLVEVKGKLLEKRQ